MPEIHAKKHLGQNFLRNPQILDTIVGDLITPTTHVVEVGPGPGDLTLAIIRKNPASLNLIELDEDMIPLLYSRFGSEKFHLTHADVLKVDILGSIQKIQNNAPLNSPGERPVLRSREQGEGNTTKDEGWKNELKIGGWAMEVGKENKIGGVDNKEESALGTKKFVTIENSKYILYGNIPYYITSPIIHHFLYDVTLAPEKMVLTMQREVAQRILAQDGKQSVLSLSCQLVATITKVCDINPNNFVPAPKVWSTCLEFTLKPEADRQVSKKILTLIERGFLQKRKKLITNISGFAAKDRLQSAFLDLGLNENIRAEDLTLEQWRDLYHLLTVA